MKEEEGKKPAFTISDRRFSSRDRAEEQPGREETPPREPPPRKPPREEPPREEPVPEAQFADLVRFLSNYAALHMVGLKDERGEVRQDLDQARLFIDLLSILKEKTAGNLTAEEGNVLDHVLYQLRMEYIQHSKGA
ncbi:MAG: DUF1844 domain-containing protein [Nitrospinota bacterium]